MAPNLELLLQHYPIYIKVIEALDEVALGAVGDRHYRHMRFPNLALSYFLTRGWASAAAALTCARVCYGCAVSVQGVLVAMLWEPYSATSVRVATKSKIKRNLC